MRGEHIPGASGKLQEAGSSPHARGAHTIFAPILGHKGIIPACAGSTRR